MVQLLSEVLQARASCQVMKVAEDQHQALFNRLQHFIPCPGVQFCLCCATTSKYNHYAGSS